MSCAVHRRQPSGAADSLQELLTACCAIINLCLCNDVFNLWDVALSSVMVSVVLLHMNVVTNDICVGRRYQY
jgi:hypothetical protein